MDDIFVYVVPLPWGFNEAVLKCADGYTVYLSDRLGDAERRAAYRHALRHIERGDWQKSDVQEIERDAHEG